jgi:hypothetical protein
MHHNNLTHGESALRPEHLLGTLFRRRVLDRIELNMIFIKLLPIKCEVR